MSLSKRQTAAAKFRPKKVRLLLVAEAPPCTAGRYFYFEFVSEHDWLFRYVWEGLTGEKPDRADKGGQLARLQDAGVFLVDLHEENISGPTVADLKPCVAGLIERCRKLKPEHIILIKSSTYNAAYEALVEAGLPVVDERMPFPASGQQRRFLEFFRKALACANFKAVIN